MNNVKKFIGENRILIIITVLILVAFLIYSIVSNLKDNEIYYTPEPESEPDFTQKEIADNQYRVIVMDEVDMVSLYYKEYLNMLLKNPEEAWKYTFTDGENNGIDFDNKYEQFTKEIKNRTTSLTEQNVVEKYSIEKIFNHNIITVIDSQDYMYVFYEYGVWDYKVVVLGQVRTD